MDSFKGFYPELVRVVPNRNICEFEFIRKKVCEIPNLISYGITYCGYICISQYIQTADSMKVRD